MRWFHSISDWLHETHTYGEERITNGESILVVTLLLLVGIGMVYVLYRELFAARRIDHHE